MDPTSTCTATISIAAADDDDGVAENDPCPSMNVTHAAHGGGFDDEVCLIIIIPHVVEAIGIAICVGEEKSVSLGMGMRKCTAAISISCLPRIGKQISLPTVEELEEEEEFMTEGCLDVDVLWNEGLMDVPPHFLCMSKGEIIHSMDFMTKLEFEFALTNTFKLYYDAACESKGIVPRWDPWNPCSAFFASRFD